MRKLKKLQRGGTPNFGLLTPEQLAALNQSRADNTTVPGITMLPSAVVQQNQVANTINLAAKKRADTNELKRRKDAIAKSNKTGKFSDSAVKDRMRFFPNDPNSTFDEWFNPLTMIGSMADNLGHSKTPGQFALNTVAPVTAGALAGLGTKTTGEFVNNLINPVAGIPSPVKKNGIFYVDKEILSNPNVNKKFDDAIVKSLNREKQNIDKSKRLLDDVQDGDSWKYSTDEINSANNNKFNNLSDNNDVLQGAIPDFLNQAKDEVGNKVAFFNLRNGELNPTESLSGRNWYGGMDNQINKNADYMSRFHDYKYNPNLNTFEKAQEAAKRDANKVFNKEYENFKTGYTGLATLPLNKNGGKVNDDNGYLTSNLHNFTPVKRINSNHITTDGMAFPIVANGIQLFPDTGDYFIPGDGVIERPLLKAQNGASLSSPRELQQMQQSQASSTHVNNINVNPPILQNAYYNSQIHNEPGVPIKYRDDFTNKGWLSKQAAGSEMNVTTGFGPLVDLYRYYAGFPLNHNALQISKYKPTNSKNPNSRYISINDDEFTKEVLQNYNRIFKHNKLAPDESKINNNTYKVSGYVNRDDNGELIPHKRGVVDGVSGAIGNYFLSKGSDDKGDYVSYYDTFDRGTGKEGTDLAEKLRIAKSFEIYGRIYIDKDGNPIKKQGGTINNFLPKAQNGMQVVNPDDARFYTPISKQQNTLFNVVPRPLGLRPEYDINGNPVNNTSVPVNPDAPVMYENDPTQMVQKQPSAATKKKTILGDISKFIGDNPAQVMDFGLGLLNNSLYRDPNDDKRDSMLGGSDNLYSSPQGSTSTQGLRGDWTVNEGYQPDKKVVTQFQKGGDVNNQFNKKVTDMLLQKKLADDALVTYSKRATSPPVFSDTEAQKNYVQLPLQGYKDAKANANVDYNVVAPQYNNLIKALPQFLQPVMGTLKENYNYVDEYQKGGSIGMTFGDNSVKPSFGADLVPSNVGILSGLVPEETTINAPKYVPRNSTFTPNYSNQDNMNTTQPTNSIPSDIKKDTILYLSHQQGTGGINAIIRDASGGKPVSSEIASNMKNNIGDDFYKKYGSLNAENFLSYWTNRFMSNYKKAIKTPTPWDATFDKAGDTYGLNPMFLKTVASIESDFTPTANMNKKTQYKGMFQIGTNEQKDLGITNPYDPVQSIYGGAKLIAERKQGIKFQEGGTYNLDDSQIADLKNQGYSIEYI